MVGAAHFIRYLFGPVRPSRARLRSARFIPRGRSRAGACNPCVSGQRHCRRPLWAETTSPTPRHAFRHLVAPSIGNERHRSARRPEVVAASACASRPCRRKRSRASPSSILLQQHAPGQFDGARLIDSAPLSVLHVDGDHRLRSVGVILVGSKILCTSLLAHNVLVVELDETGSASMSCSTSRTSRARAILLGRSIA